MTDKQEVDKFGPVELKIFNAIEAERNERRLDISQIHDRIDQVLNEIQLIARQPRQNNMSILILFVTVVLSLGGMLGMSIRQYAQDSSKIEHSIREMTDLKFDHMKEITNLKFLHLNQLLELKAGGRR